jgi:transcription antitermination factor NusG
MPYWCARTEVNREHVAERYLRLAGYEVYCPRIRERSRARPLFPAYCFITAALQWYRARWSIGVVALLAGASGEPAIVADGIVMELQNREGKDGLIQLPQPPQLKPGDPVRITKGLLCGLSGLYAGMRGQDRVAVLLSALGKVELAQADIEAVSSR